MFHLGNHPLLTAHEGRPSFPPLLMSFRAERESPVDGVGRDHLRYHHFRIWMAIMVHKAMSAWIRIGGDGIIRPSQFTIPYGFRLPPE